MDAENGLLLNKKLIQMIPHSHSERVIANIVRDRRHLKIARHVFPDITTEFDVIEIRVRMLYDTSIKQLECITYNRMENIRQDHPRR